MDQLTTTAREILSEMLQENNATIKELETKLNKIENENHISKAGRQGRLERAIRIGAELMTYDRMNYRIQNALNGAKE